MGFRWAISIVVLLGLTVRPAFAQQIQPVPRVGILSPYTLETSFQDNIIKELRDLGYAEGRTVVYEARHADGQTDRLSRLNFAPESS